MKNYIQFMMTFLFFAGKQWILSKSRDLGVPMIQVLADEH